MKWSRFYIIIMVLVFAAITAFLAFGPRKTYSEVERRELAVFPAFDTDSWMDGSYTAAIDSWFTDTVPFRDDITTTALALADMRGVRMKDGEEEISFHNVGTLAMNDEETEEEPLQQAEKEKADKPAPTRAPSPTPKAPASEDQDPEKEDASKPSATPTAEEKSKREVEAAPAHENTTISENFAPVAEDFTAASNGIIVTGSGETTRAIMLYGGNKTVTANYAGVANHYKELMPELNVMVCVIPTAVSYYCPEGAAAYSGSQLVQINNVIEHLRDDVIGINIYSILGEHRDEPIYLRTDHHWAPLGAYYAASKIAEAAGLPFLDISEYDEHVVHGYVGSMYMYSEDIRVSQNPEDFVYYTPRKVQYKTYYVNYILGADWSVAGEAEQKEGPFFLQYPDGSGGAYCTFMGGDAKITRVVTDTKNGRKLIILKDSFGNAIPGYLFGTYEEVHVIDSRYFTRNIQDYIEEYGITDVLFANNAFHASTPATINAYERYLTQGRAEEEVSEEAEAVEEQ